MTWQFFNFAGTDQDKELTDTIILDSGSSIDLFCNANWLTDIGLSETRTTLQTKGGPMQVETAGTLPDHGKVELSEDALTNILSLAQTTDKYRVTFDSAKDNAFYVHTPKKTVRFGRTKANLYAHTPTRMATSKPEVTPLGPKTFVQTVEENMKFHTPREIKRAKLARDLIAALGSPSVADLKAAIAMNAIANLPVTMKDVDIAEKIFGPDLGTIKGKTTRRKPLPMVTDQIAIPPQLYEKRDALDLCIDIMFVNEMPFLTSITKALF